MNPPATPALYETLIRHERRAPLRHAFTYRSYSWLTDLDAPPQLPRWLRPLARFGPAHPDGPASPGEPPLPDELRGWLAARGIRLDDDDRPGRIVMFAQPRSLGYAFNPITVFWCYRPDGELAAVVAEVHNTYQQRHRYLLHPDARGRVRTPKAFYVSPFYPVDGDYELLVPEPGERVDLVVRLHRGGQPPFVATLHGRRRSVTAGQLLRLALRHPFATWAVSVRIRWQGIRLVLRRLPIQPRPPLPPAAVPVAPKSLVPTLVRPREDIPEAMAQEKKP